MTIKYVPQGTKLFYSPLWWHKKGLQQTASGYGSILTTPWKALYNGRRYRVYATCFSNVAIHWIESKGQRLHVAGYLLVDLDTIDQTN